MKSLTTGLSALATALILISATILPTQARAEFNDPDSNSVALGTVFGEVVRNNVNAIETRGAAINPQTFIQAFVKSFAGESSGMTYDQANAHMDALMRELAQMAPISEVEIDTVSVASQREFIEKAKAVPGAVVLPSGAVFIVLVEGEGQKPGPADRVLVTYNGQLADGTVFDSTDAPIEFDVDHVIPGFSEGLQQMLPGGTYRVVIPSDAAYGPNGIPGAIPGNAALDFTVTLDRVIPNK